MVVSDPIADFLIRIKNASLVKKETVRVPYSKLKEAIARILKENGFIADVEKKGRKVKKELIITLAYKEDGTPRIEDVRRLSKPSRRLYRKAKDLHPVRYGKGIMVISTSKGLMTDAEARKAGLGGETLFEIY